jgi:TAG lipase/lysophosphatidylethanolamine acyltransferase
LVSAHELYRRQNPTDKYYDYRLIYDRLQAITEAWDDQDIPTLLNLLRSGLVRNLGNITTPRLYNRAYAGTKLLIEDYITQVALAIEQVTILPTSPTHFAAQEKLDLLHDTRQAFGRSTLVLQGGAIFGLCHLGVVKALHLNGLLPRIITGTATGALIAALVAVHTEDELLDFLTGEGIDLTAFEEENDAAAAAPAPRGWQSLFGFRDNSGLLSTTARRLARFIKEGYFLDTNVLEKCVRANVGDLTFEEAYARTKRVLNITISTSGKGGVPNVLNYITAPHVLIWSAALASNTTDAPSPSSPLTLKCKDEKGNITEWALAADSTFRPWTHASYAERESPLARVAELFNVNHFIISQARPYLAPFLRSEMSRPDPQYRSRWRVDAPLLRLFAMEAHHRLAQLDSLGLLPPSIRRFLVDESIPGASLTLVPEVSAHDLLRLLETPTKESVESWILRGERSVWPAVSALKVRCAVEVELDRGYQIVRRKPVECFAMPAGQRNMKVGELQKRESRIRAASTGGQ